MAASGSSSTWSPSTKLAVAVGLVLFVGLLIHLARGALALIALAGVLAFLIAPLVRFLNRRLRFPRVLALLVSYVVVLFGALLISVIVANGVINSVSEIDPPEAAESLRTTALDALEDLEDLEMFGYQIDLSEVIEPLQEQLEEAETDQQVADEEDEAATITVGQDEVGLIAGTAVDSLRTVGGIVLALVFSGLVTLLIAVYLNVDSRKFSEGLRRYVPNGYERDAEMVTSRIVRIWKGYLYGQLINSLATGLLVWFALWLVGLPGAFVLGVIMALLNMIPTFGPIIAAVPGILSALALGSTRLDMSHLTFALLVTVMYVVVVQLQANVMAPLITGRAVHMSPASVLIGLVVGVQVAGLIGALLVVPVMGTGKELVKYLMAKLTDRDPFPEVGAATEGPPDQDRGGGGSSSGDDPPSADPPEEPGPVPAGV